MTQATIDWDNIVHLKENKRSNEVILNGCRVRLANNCRLIYNDLMRGDVLSGRLIVARTGMLEYRKRINELKDAGLPIQERTTASGAKEWWLTKEYRENKRE